MIKTKVRDIASIKIRMRKKQIIPTTRNCFSCASNDDVIGCRLKGQLSPSNCIINGFSYYKKGKQFFFCERCKTCSVTSQIAGFRKNEPRIVFWCQNCDDFPIIEGEEYRGYAIEGMTFLKRRDTFLDRKDDKRDIFR
jgi:RNase P subunit RPR2